jgi:anti-sigma regulatory factor (Ser/Thr protein kinase)
VSELQQKKPRKSIAEKEVLSFSETREYLNVSRVTLLKLTRAGKILGSKLVDRWHYLKADVDFYIRHGKNPLVAEAEEKEKARMTGQETDKAEKILTPKKPKSTITTALLLKHAVEILSATPCYLIGPASQSLLNTHVSEGSAEWDLTAKGSLAEVLSRVAELLFTEEVPVVSYQREELMLPADIQSLEIVKEKLAEAVVAVGFSRDDGFKLKMCADELVTNAVHAGSKELRIIIETGTDDLLLTVINRGAVKDVAGRMPKPEAERGRGIELTKGLMDDFLLLSTNEKVIVTIRKVRVEP